MQIRLIGTEAEISSIVATLNEEYKVTSESRLYSAREPNQKRKYLNIELKGDSEENASSFNIG